MSPVFTFTSRFLLLFILMGSWYYGAWLVALPLTLWYTYRYPAYELVVVGVLLDIQFYTGDFIPYYGISAVLFVAAFRLGEPHFRSRTHL